jgi:aryl-alcohol dehydrogenase-like predicted oxidoreductase
MEYRRMGNSDLVVSAIGFGCWEMGGTNYGPVDDQEEIEAVHRAMDLGVTLFDTAPVYGYGHSEEVLGRALGPRRKDVVLVTKCGLTWDPVTKTTKRDSRYSAIMSGVEASLQRLGTDYVDLLLIHWPDVQTPFEESMRALNDVVQQGKARYLGVSNFSSAQLRECVKYARLVANQVGYNLFDRRWEREMFPTAQELGVGIMAYGPLAHGLLTGTFTPQTVFEPPDWRARGVIFGQPLFQRENFLKNLEVVERLKDVARRLDTSLPRLALAWVLHNPQVSVALSGTRRAAEIEENVRALDVTLTPEILAELDTIMQGAAGQTDQIPT